MNIMYSNELRNKVISIPLKGKVNGEKLTVRRWIVAMLTKLISRTEATYITLSE